jgi:formate hydrogenlyase subunit 3/multisubunit Na+/H+ antiporter MnhD subunit
MNAESIITVICVLTGISFLIIPLLPARYKSLTALSIVALNALITSIPAVKVLCGENFSLQFNGGNIFGNILLEIDPLSAWFILIINLTLFNGALYGTGYMKAYASRRNDLSLHWIMFVLFHVSMLWVCMLRNSFAFLIAWEIMTLSSLLLLMFDHDKASTLHAGLNYLIQMHIGVALLSIAFIWISITEQTTGFEGIASFIANGKSVWVILLFFTGFGIKAGFIPLHTWLPYAHPAAPSHISGVMSGVIVKMGIYGIVRIAMHINQHAITAGVILVLISAVTTLYGILNASVHRDFKKMLAYCTTENIGIIGMGIGMALIGFGLNHPVIMVLGISAALLHTLNHSLYKSLLFFSSGNIYLQTHTRNMELLGGLIRYMPHTAIIFLTGALAIGGFPPLNGFISKFLVYSSFIESFNNHNLALSALMILCTAILSMAGGVSMLTFAKAFGVIFLGEPRSEYYHKPTEVPLLMRVPLYLIIVIMLAIGIFPDKLLTPLFHIAQSLTAMPILAIPGLSNTMIWSGRASLILLAIIVILLLIRSVSFRGKSIETHPTWGCGYVAPEVSMQYTGKSFSKSLAKLFGFITIENKKYKELKSASVFPSSRTYVSNYLEFFETRLIEPLVKQFLRVFNLFTFIHNGKIQFYVLYGLIFIIIMIVLSVFNVL